jgi:disulfide bond formation protein DsbB
MSNFLTSRWYGAFFATTGIGLLVAALFYQYVLGEEPCQVCIHARLWVSGWALTGLIMVLAPQTFGVRSLGHLGILIAGTGLAERALYLYQLENGIGDGSCEFQLGMPEWFAVDRWFPWLFEVRNLCSYTPEIGLGISMAEALLGVAIALSIAAALVWASECKTWLRKKLRDDELAP